MLPEVHLACHSFDQIGQIDKKHDKMKEKIKVFFDTTALLDSFLLYRRFKDSLEGNILSFSFFYREIELFKQIPIYLRDEDAQRVTFEKCIYEAYAAFRGVGGKKPDEGRGDWAQRHLKRTSDPKSVAQLTEKFHNQGHEKSEAKENFGKENTFFWINHIDSFYCNDYGCRTGEIEELVMEKSKFEGLCDELHAMLKFFNFNTIYYNDIFNLTRNNTRSNYSPECLDHFARMTAIPSEDFEIVYAAENIGADIFLTKDRRLIICSKSLGLNSLLGPCAFCEQESYETRKQELIR